jgi:hypothetical protein
MFKDSMSTGMKVAYFDARPARLIHLDCVQIDAGLAEHLRQDIRVLVSDQVEHRAALSSEIVDDELREPLTRARVLCSVDVGREG